MTIASTVNFVPFDRRRRWSPVYHTEEGISRCTTKVNSIRPSAFTELRHEPVHLLVDQPKRHRFVAHQRLHSTQMNPHDALPHAHSTGHVGERPVTSVTICHTCSRSRGSYISRLLERLPHTSQTNVAFCRTLVVAHCGPTPMTCGSCLCREHITNSVIGVYRPPVIDFGTTFHPDSGGRDLPLTPSDNL